MLSENLKKIRKERKLSLRALSEKAEVSKSTLSDIENHNVKSTTMGTLEKIAEALEVSVSYLIGETIEQVIKTRLEELGITLEEFAQQSGLSVNYLEKLSDIVPDEWDYQNAKKIAIHLKLNPENLITALAKQEPPTIDYPNTRATAEEDFGSEDDEKGDGKPTPSVEEVFTLAAQFVDYEEPLTELDIEKMKVALKVALSQSSNKG